MILKLVSNDNQSLFQAMQVSKQFNDILVRFLKPDQEVKRYEKRFSLYKKENKYLFLVPRSPAEDIAFFKKIFHDEKCNEALNKRVNV